MDNDTAVLDVERFPEVKYLRGKTAICIEAPSVTGHNEPRQKNLVAPNLTYFQLHGRHESTFKSKSSSTGLKNLAVKIYGNEAPTTLNRFSINSSNEFDMLKKSFDKEILKYGHYLSSPSEIISSEFTNVALALSELRFDAGIVEFVENVGFRFTMVFPNEKMLLITKSIGNDHELKDNNILYNFFVNRDLIAADAMDLRTFVEGFKEYLIM